VSKPPADLRETQEIFWDLIAAPEGVQPGLAGLARTGRLEREDLSFLIDGDKRLGAVERLDIYANMYFYRLRDGLAEDYPKVSAIIGGADFHNLVTDYLLRHPSTHWSLRYLGAALPGFLAGHPLAERFPFLADLARLEWARIDVFDAPDAPLLSRDSLTSRSPEVLDELPIRPIPASRLLALDWNVAPVWRTVEDDLAGDESGGTHSAAVMATGSECFSSPLAIDPPERRRCHLLVWRHDFAVLHRSLNAVESACLAAAAGGEATLPGLCRVFLEEAEPQPVGAAGETDDGPAAGVDAASRQMAGYLGRWLEDGLLREVEPGR
jgi:hypothetical protein